jgi:small-conductance mechanosensitive channel/CRP-like cAMP-binding protein
VPASHPIAHAFVGTGLVTILAALIVVVRNRAVRRRLLVSAAVGAAAVALHVAVGLTSAAGWPGGAGTRLEDLLLAFSAGSAAITLIFNSWRTEGRPPRAPAIVQDAFLVVLLAGSAAVVFNVSSFNVLTGSAIVAAIIGFALQETLGNAFAGIAIQIERPFRVGHWIAAGDHVGRVVEVTWRATKILTKAGNLTVVPNSQMAAHAIQNYSEPSVPTRIEIEVGAAYGTPPNDVRDAVLAATRQARYVLADPAPEVLLADFGPSAIVYQARFWVDDFSQDGRAKDAVRTAVYYEFRRRGIEIPWPIQVEYRGEEKRVDVGARQHQFAAAVASVPVLAGLPEDAHRAIATAAEERLFGGGEVIVREGDPGGSMFIVMRGRATIAVGAERHEVAVAQPGGYFGEMSLLTGEPRSATVIARGDCLVLEIEADAFRSYVQANPAVIDQLASAATRRRQELEQARAGSAAAIPPTQASLSDRMRRFFGLH